MTYLESARVNFFAQQFSVGNVKDMTFILAHVDIDFKRPITLEDHPEVILWVESVGNTSWRFGYKISDSIFVHPQDSFTINSVSVTISFFIFSPFIIFIN